jgi:lipopolysaccharide/colanic/teichoic acid biosynthesis glycosyltransferase
LLLPIWIVLWTLIPFLIWLEDRGPVFYKQNRVGKNERIFTIRKFRTMRGGQAEGEPTIPVTDNDPRVTRIGRFLRRTALDELPQILSILKGDMSFVGPRPMPPDFHQEFLNLNPEAYRRVLVRPGLSGLAQVYGRYDSGIAEKLDYDFIYLEKMSLWLDCKLLIISVWKTLLGRWELGSKENDRARSVTSRLREDR